MNTTASEIKNKKTRFGQITLLGSKTPLTDINIWLNTCGYSISDTRMTIKYFSRTLESLFYEVVAYNICKDVL